MEVFLFLFCREETLKSKEISIFVHSETKFYFVKICKDIYTNNGFAIIKISNLS